MLITVTEMEFHTSPRPGLAPAPLTLPPSLPSVPSAADGGSTWLASFFARLPESNVGKVAIGIIVIGFAVSAVVAVLFGLWILFAWLLSLVGVDRFKRQLRAVRYCTLISHLSLTSPFFFPHSPLTFVSLRCTTTCTATYTTICIIPVSLSVCLSVPVCVLAVSIEPHVLHDTCN